MTEKCFVFFIQLDHFFYYRYVFAIAMVHMTVCSVDRLHSFAGHFFVCAYAVDKLFAGSWFFLQFWERYAQKLRFKRWIISHALNESFSANLVCRRHWWQVFLLLFRATIKYRFCLQFAKFYKWPKISSKFSTKRKENAFFESLQCVSVRPIFRPSVCVLPRQLSSGTSYRGTSFMSSY